MHTHARWNRRPAGACFCALLAALLPGCAQLLGLEPLDERQTDAAAPIDARLADARPVDARPIDAGIDTTCSDGVIENGTGTTPIDTEPAGNELSATCGGDTSPDQILLWTAPVTDYYVFDTFGSGFDTVLAVFDECGGNELACNNNVGSVSQSELVHKFQQGQQALVLVDGAAGDSGQGALNIARVTCPDADLEGQTFPVELSTLGFGDDLKGRCGGEGHEDRAYHWVAPADGLYYFRATAETFSPIITLLDGPRCSDRELACNGTASRDYGAEAVRFLRAGQPVTVVVDGKDGAGLFTLDIGLKANQTCPESMLAAGTSLADNFDGPTLSASCWPTRATDMFAGLYEVPDKIYTFQVTGRPGPGCGGACSVTVTSPGAFVLYAVEGAECGGAEVNCLLADPVASGPASATLSISVQDEARLYSIVIADRFPFDDDGFQIEGDCFLIC